MDKPTMDKIIEILSSIKSGVDFANEEEMNRIISLLEK